MDSRKLVFQETAIVLMGQAVCIAAMFGIFALLGRFDLSVLWGGLAGGAVAVLNFFVMAVCTNLAADKAEAQDVAGGKKLIQLSYIGRLLVMFIVLFACAKSGLFNLFALLLPLIFTRPVLTIAEFFRKSGEAKS